MYVSQTLCHVQVLTPTLKLLGVSCFARNLNGLLGEILNHRCQIDPCGQETRVLSVEAKRLILLDVFCLIFVFHLAQAGVCHNP